MQIPTMSGTIDRRILVNFRIDPGVMARNLPSPFRPKVVNGYAIGGICLIRLIETRPRFSPLPWGIRSENGAHRFAIEWEADGQICEGVYIPRRDTNSWLNTLAGGRIFPGVHHHARFEVEEVADYFSVTASSDDDDTYVHVSGHVASTLPDGSCFATVADASRFFENGSLGYSATAQPGHFDGLELCCRAWHVEPLAVESVASSYFEDKSRWPDGSVAFDCALLMRGIEHEWHGRDVLYWPHPPAPSP